MNKKQPDMRSLESIQDWMKHTDFETRVKYWMKRPGWEGLAGEPLEMTHEIIRRRGWGKRKQRKHVAP
jgi:hypothetical protein